MHRPAHSSYPTTLTGLRVINFDIEMRYGLFILATKAWSDDNKECEASSVVAPSIDGIFFFLQISRSGFSSWYKVFRGNVKKIQ